MNDDQPDWIRDLYREAYPTAPIYPVGPRNNPTRVSGWQGSGPLVSRQDLNPRTATFENQMAGMMPPPSPNLGTPGPISLMPGMRPPNVQPPTTTGSIGDWSTTVTPNTPPPQITPPTNSPPTGGLIGPMSRPPPPTNMTPMPPGPTNTERSAEVDRLLGMGLSGDEVRNRMGVTRPLIPGFFTNMGRATNASVAPWGGIGARQTPRHDFNPRAIAPGDFIRDLIDYLRTGATGQSAQTFGGVNLP